MSEALDFVKNFEDLIKKNDEEQRKSYSLSTTRDALEKEIEVLLGKKKSIETQIEAKLKVCDKEIIERKENAERIICQENDRLTKLSDKLETQRKEQEGTESRQRQEQVQLDEKERILFEKESSLKHREVDIEVKREQIKKDKEELASFNMCVRQERERIEKDNRGIGEAKIGIRDAEMALHKANELLQNERDSLNISQVEQEKLKKQNLDDSIAINKEWDRIAKEKKDIEALIVNLTKQQKDNDDKEKALQAMKIEIDFKMAQFKRKYAKDK